VIPYSGTFLVFSDYSRPAIRLGALMGARVIHVMTHDSIGLGEDGPTHQPVEHLACAARHPQSARLPPRGRGGDRRMLASCAEAAGPSVLALSRQKTPAVRFDAGEIRSSRGAYELLRAEGEAQVTLFGTGTEVALAVKARDLLAAEGVAARVVSVPCFELFERQDAAYQAATIGTAPVRVAVEAAVRQGWDRFIGEHGAFVGMTGFGASAPAERLYAEFGITAEAIAAVALARSRASGDRFAPRRASILRP
jgi:transketolase